MSISATTQTGPYTGNGSTTVFPYDFTVTAGTELYVTVGGVTVSTSSYTVTINANGTGSVVFGAAPAIGALVMIYQNPDWLQDSQFETQGAYSLASVNAINRRYTVRDNWLSRAVAALLPSGWQTPANLANKFMGFDTNGLPIAVPEGGVASLLRANLLASAGSSLVGFIQSGTGAVARTAQDKLRESVSVADFGAVGNGVTNDSAAFLTALTAADCVVIPAGTYLLNTNITIPAGRTLNGEGRSSVSILTTANVTTFTIGGNGVAISGVAFDHSGTGIIIDATQDEDLVLDGCTFQSATAAATNPLVKCTGSFAAIRDCVMTNSRTNAYTLVLDRTGVTINIESHIAQNRFGGTGKGVWIGSSDNSARPEGIYITHNTFIGTNINLFVEQVFQMTVASNVFDQGNGQNVVFKPVNTGIENVQLTGNYFSTPNSASVGIAVNHDNTNPTVPFRYISFTGNSFAFCGYGVAFGSGASKITITGNTFAAIGSGGVVMDQSKEVVITSNVFGSITGANIILTDGANGGPFVVDGNIFDSAASTTFTRTNNSKFALGFTNRGRTLAQFSSTATSTTAKPTGSYVAIPHGLVGTPLLERIVVSIVPASSSVMLQGATALVATVDSANITVQVNFTAASGGNYNVTALASL